MPGQIIDSGVWSRLSATLTLSSALLVLHWGRETKTPWALQTLISGCRGGGLCARQQLPPSRSPTASLLSIWRIKGVIVACLPVRLLLRGRPAGCCLLVPAWSVRTAGSCWAQLDPPSYKWKEQTPWQSKNKSWALWAAQSDRSVVVTAERGETQRREATRP